MDIDKILKENQDLKSNYDLLVKERKELIQFIKSIDCPPSKKYLVGPVELTEHVINHLVKSRDLAVEDMKGAMERSENRFKALKEAWFIIDKLITGMFISDKRWKLAVDWLNRNRL